MFRRFSEYDWRIPGLRNTAVILTGGSRGRGPRTYAFLCPKRFIFSFIFLRSRFILSRIVLEICPKHAKNDFLYQPSTLSIIFYTPRCQSQRPSPLRSNSRPATDSVFYELTLAWKAHDVYECSGFLGQEAYMYHILPFTDMNREKHRWNYPLNPVIWIRFAF